MTFLGRMGFLPGQATIIAAVVAFAGLFSYLKESTQAAGGQAEAMRKFERRRIDAIKGRICSRMPAAALGAAATVKSYRFPRPEALKALEYMSTKAGLYMVVGPKGEGKTTLVSQFVAARTPMCSMRTFRTAPWTRQCAPWRWPWAMT